MYMYTYPSSSIIIIEYMWWVCFDGEMGIWKIIYSYIQETQNIYILYYLNYTMYCIIVGNRSQATTGSSHAVTYNKYGSGGELLLLLVAIVVVVVVVVTKKQCKNKNQQQTTTTTRSHHNEHFFLILFYFVCFGHGLIHFCVLTHGFGCRLLHQLQ